MSERQGGTGARRARLGLGLGIAAFLASIALFAAVLYVSFDLIQGDKLDEPQGRLEPVAITGPEETVFSWRRDACAPLDIPDLPARAFRDGEGRVQLISSSYVNRRFEGPSLDRLRHGCEVVMSPQRDPDPARRADREWLAAPYTLDGRTVYSLVHDEYQGDKHPGRCPSGDYLKCWYNSITLAVSRDGGDKFEHAAPAPGHLVASVPYPYEPDAGPFGLFAPSNIVFNQDDGHYYAMVRATQYRDQQFGACVMRTKTLADPRSWRVWDGNGFDRRFADYYTEANVSPRAHVCPPVSLPQIGSMSESITYNEYLEKWVLVGSSQDTVGGQAVHGIYYSVSDDLVRWSRRRLIREVEFVWSFACGDPNPVGYPSVLDPASDSRNFETTGRTAYLYFTRFHYSNCQQNLNRDLVRVPIRFSK